MPRLDSASVRSQRPPTQAPTAAAVQEGDGQQPVRHRTNPHRSAIEMVFHRNLSSEDMFALEALRDEANQNRAAEEAMQAHAARLHHDCGIAKSAIAEYAGVSRPTIYAWLKKHPPKWRTYKLLTEFDDEPATTRIGFRLPVDWLESKMDDSAITDAIFGYERILDNDALKDTGGACRKALATAAGTSLLIIQNHYGEPCAYRLLHAWLRLGGIDNTTLKDITAWQP